LPLPTTDVSNGSTFFKVTISFGDVPPNSLKNLMRVLKRNNIKRKKVGACSLTWNTSRVGGHARALGWDEDKFANESSR
jgi:hypothetical protein